MHNAHDDKGHGGAKTMNRDDDRYYPNTTGGYDGEWQACCLKNFPSLKAQTSY